MLDKIIDLVKDQALNVISNNADIPSEKKNAAVETTTSSIVDGLKGQLSLDNISNLTGLFSGSSSSSNALSSSLQNSVVSALAEKVGLSKNVASSIASTVIPAVMGLIAKKNSDPNDSFDLASIAKSISSSDNKKGGILGALGSLLGK